LILHITEAHRFYADSLYLRIWWHEEGDAIDEEESPHSFVAYVNNYIKAGETLKYCIELTDPEIANAGGDIGTGENWSAYVERCVHLRKEDPVPLRERDQADSYCD
jgi:hypothetical protein